MCFSPQRRAILRHRNFKKCFGGDVFCTFSLQNVLFATAACNFWCHLSAPTSAPAALTGLLLDWPDTRIYEKTQHFVTSLTFGADVSSFLLTFWLLHLLSTDLTTLLLLFNSPYCRKFLFKLPSTKIVMIIDGLLPKGPKICSLPRCNQPLNASWVREPRVHDKGIENYEVKDQDCKAPVKNMGSSLSKFSIWIVTWLSPFSATPKIPHAFRNQRNCRQESSVSLSGVFVPVHGQ